MNCKEARTHMFRPDGRREEAERHAAGCPGCRAFERDYAAVLKMLKAGGEPEPLPYFRERLWAKIAEREKVESWTLWMRWSLRAIPVSLVLIAVFIGAILFLGPALDDDMSQPAALLLRNANPLTETNALFNEDKIEAKSMMIMFAGSEFASSRRYRP
jgi:predicted anti-sigma-YlaC factor YlaD